MIQATNTHFTLPDRGLLGPHAFFDPAMLDIPEMDEAFTDPQNQAGEYQVEIKKRGEVSRVTYPYNPLDAVGWHGDLAPVRLNVKDLRPVTSHRYHLPPSVHTTFLSDRFVVCTFAPRPFETDPGALKVPFFHNNDDFEEVLFYHAGDFFSRDHIEAGMMTFHPSGFTHGPHPKALKNMLTQPKPATDEYAVMIDTRDPLEVGKAAASVENPAYVDSWKNSRASRPTLKTRRARNWSAPAPWGGRNSRPIRRGGTPSRASPPAAAKSVSSAATCGKPSRAGIFVSKSPFMSRTPTKRALG
jgi:homogentisate 1,2-dioxygenase